jgi:hypothetical protein
MFLHGFIGVITSALLSRQKFPLHAKFNENNIKFFHNMCKILMQQVVNFLVANFLQGSNIYLKLSEVKT